jgi:hypothetical protein
VPLEEHELTIKSDLFRSFPLHRPDTSTQAPYTNPLTMIASLLLATMATLAPHIVSAPTSELRSDVAIPRIILGEGYRPTDSSILPRSTRVWGEHKCAGALHLPWDEYHFKRVISVVCEGRDDPNLQRAGVNEFSLKGDDLESLWRTIWKAKYVVPGSNPQVGWMFLLAKPDGMDWPSNYSPQLHQECRRVLPHRLQLHQAQWLRRISPLRRPRVCASAT